MDAVNLLGAEFRVLLPPFYVDVQRSKGKFYISLYFYAS